MADFATILCTLRLKDYEISLSKLFHDSLRTAVAGLVDKVLATESWDRSLEAVRDQLCSTYDDP